MTEFIYGNINPDRNLRIVQDANAERKRQRSQHTGSEHVRMRRYRLVTVCLVLLCVLLLTAVIVLCVLINTNNQQFDIKNKNITEERDQLQTKYTNLTEERDELIVQCGQKKDLAFKGFVLTDKWIYNQSSFYFISSENKSWSESRSYCIERGADLIIINNKEEQDFVKNAAIKQIWIGLSDSDEEGRWKWVDNSTLTSSFWGPGEPNGGTRENCVESYPSEWNDINCNTALKWICEKNILK